MSNQQARVQELFPGWAKVEVRGAHIARKKIVVFFPLFFYGSNRFYVGQKSLVYIHDDVFLAGDTQEEGFNTDHHQHSYE